MQILLCFFIRILICCPFRAFLELYNMGQKHQKCQFTVILEWCFSQSEKWSFSLKKKLHFFYNVRWSIPQYCGGRFCRACWVGDAWCSILLVLHCSKEGLIIAFRMTVLQDTAYYSYHSKVGVKFISKTIFWILLSSFVFTWFNTCSIVQKKIMQKNYALELFLFLFYWSHK